ncbi:hypothetical protein C8J56DRAFT_846949 [Mycena floridula]|nr:hypothetical protein C8J56DRAFT_846949 [Mycena floridula]
MYELPPLAENAVFYVSASTIIEAPIEKVWNIMLDFQAYGEWNSFVRAQTIIDDNGQALASQTLTRPGQKMRIHTNIPPTMEPGGLFQKHTTHVISKTVDTINHRVQWVTGRAPKFWLYADRWQMLTVLDDGRVKYETVETMQGLLAYLVKWFVGNNLRIAFKTMGERLKARAERS